MNQGKQDEEKFEFKISKLFQANNNSWVSGMTWTALGILGLIPIIMGLSAAFIQINDSPNKEAYWLFCSGVAISFLIGCFLMGLYKKLDFLLKKQSKEIIKEWEKSFANILPTGKKPEDEIVKISNNIFEQRATLWKNAHSGNEENNLLRSLVYPASSLYSVTAFIIGKDQNNKPTDMLFMIPKNETNTNQIYEVLGQRMPVNSLPHCFVKSLVKKYVYEYNNDEIEFSSKFHEKEKEVDDFTKTVPLPYRIQEESNIQFGGNPFHLDHIYVLEVPIISLLGVGQANLTAIWINFEKVKKICANGLNPKVYGETSVDSRKNEYIKFESQKDLAVEIIDKYIQIKK